MQGGRLNSWKDQWWIPITWAICLINAHHPKSQGCEIKDQKDFVGQLNRFQSKLHEVSEYQNNPLPLIYGQALMGAIYAWFILGVFGAQYLTLGHSVGLWILVAIPWFQVLIRSTTMFSISLCLDGEGDGHICLDGSGKHC